MTPPSEKALRWIRAMKGSVYRTKYLKSRLWREVIRPKVFERDNYRCVICQRGAKQVHHLDYDEATMLGLDLSKLKSVCERHHDSSHFGSPILALGPLTARFEEVAEEQRQEDLARDKFKSVGGRLVVRSKSNRGWCGCDFRWDFEPELSAVADLSDRYFYESAYFRLYQDYHNRNPGKAGGTKLKPKEGGPHTLIFLWDSFFPARGKIKIRESAFADWVATMKELTSMHPFPVFIIDEKSGLEIARSGGYVAPQKPPIPPTKTLVEKWIGTTITSSISETDPDWARYPIGETVIDHGKPYPEDASTPRRGLIWDSEEDV